MRSMTVLVVAAVLAGCHAKFKREVRNIDDAQMQILTQAGPSATLGKAGYVGDPSPATRNEAAANVVGGVAVGVFNVVQAVKEAELRDRIAKAVNIEVTNSAMMEGLARALGNGPPFSIAGAGASDNLLQFEVVRWGLEVPAVGAQGVFTYDVRARMYKAGGERIYSSRLSCELMAGSPDAASQALMLVNNAKQVKSMTDEQLQDAFNAMASYCGGVFVAKMRRHAG